MVPEVYAVKSGIALCIEGGAEQDGEVEESGLKCSPMSRPKSGQFKVVFAASFMPCR